MRVRDLSNSEAWRMFVALYAPLVYRYGRRQGLQDADAADLTQEVMGEVARSIRRFEYQPSQGRFRDWLFTISRRRLLKLRGRVARHREHATPSDKLESLEDGRDPAMADWNDAFHLQVLKEAMRRIKPSFEPLTWRAFERVWLEKRSAAETASELSLRIDRVYVAKSRVLKKLAEEVQAIVADYA